LHMWHSFNEHRGRLRPFIFALILVSIIWTIWQFDLPRYLNVTGMRELADAHAPYGPLLFIIIFVAGLFTRIPMMGTVLVALGTVVFGGPASFAYGWLATFVGTTAIFVLVRSVARDFAIRTLQSRSQWLRALDERIARNGFRSVLVLRLIFDMAPMLNWGLGLTGVRLWHCLGATALGIIPNLIVAVIFADTIIHGLPSGGILFSWLSADRMSGLVTVLRVASLFAFAGPMLLAAGGRDRNRDRGDDKRRGEKTPVLANFAAFGLFIALLIAFARDADGAGAPMLAVCGCLFAGAGGVLIFWSRRELGSAWSFVPTVAQDTGFVTTGPYRIIRHPIYLGFCLLAMGQALAFGSWPAVLAVLFVVVPTLVWRARAEESLLADMFADHYDQYRRQTKLMIPYLL
jgi:protein-S-isoprenylcysteine O-methyltransferase Ste14/uncharacterized membrane protein YdjX (TVP38/TMEM64 family)